MIIALAGRRIDAPDAPTPRFPSENVRLVQSRLADLFAREGATALVSSGACGADLVALEVAGARGMQRRVVLARSEERRVGKECRSRRWADGEREETSKRTVGDE